MKPIYEATTTIDVDRQAPPGIIGQDAKRPDVDSDYDQFLATQVKLIQSDSVLRPVAQRYNLPEKEGQVTQGHALAPIALRNLFVTRPANTFLLEIGYRSSDPVLAAEVANAIANSYIEHIFRSRVEASAKLSSFMDKQMEELKIKMDKSGVALTQYQREMDIINPEDKTNILSARLMQLNTEYTSAQADRVRKQAASQSAESGTLETAIISTQGDALKHLVEKENEAEEKFTLVKEHFGTEHPEYRKAEAQTQELQRQIEVTKASLIKRAQSEFQEASNREQILEHAVADVRTQFNQMNLKAFAYEQQKREAEGDRKLYEELTRRIKEADINANFDNNAIRLADMARPPADPISPRIKQNTLFAFLFSSLLGCGAILLGQKLNKTVQYSEQVSHLLSANVVGILPVVKAWRSPKGPPSFGGFRRQTLAITAEVEKGYFQSVTAFEESIRTLRNSILLGGSGPIRTILVTSASTGEGKSTTALHLALAHAAHGMRTLLIDGDLRRPTLRRLLNTGSTFGLADALVTDQSVTSTVLQLDDHPHLRFIPSGEPSQLAADLLGQRIPEILEYFAPDYDLIVVDGPPFLGIAESLRLASSVDTVVVVARAGRTKQASLELVLNLLAQLRANIAGIVLNQAPAAIGELYGNYRCG
jgi:capsular exopolysaccharide synthesis family protein